jgi:hypothetical protein
LIIVAAFEAPAVVAGFDDVAVVDQTTEQRGGHLGVAEHAGEVDYPRPQQSVRTRRPTCPQCQLSE